MTQILSKRESDVCPRCGGDGTIETGAIRDDLTYNSTTCSKCHGRGVVEYELLLCHVCKGSGASSSSDHVNLRPCDNCQGIGKIRRTL